MPKYDDFDLDLQKKSSIYTSTAKSGSGSYPANTCYCPSNCCPSDDCGHGTYPVRTCYCK